MAVADGCPTCGRPWPAEKRVIPLVDKGLTTAEIAAELGITERRVQAVRAKAGRGAPRGQGHRKKQPPTAP